MGKYNIPVDEIKDIKKELNKQSSNGNGGGVKEWYYEINISSLLNDLNLSQDNLTDDIVQQVWGMISIFAPDRVLIAAGNDDNYDIRESVNWELTKFNLTRLKVIKISNNKPAEGIGGSPYKVRHIYGNLEQRAVGLNNFINGFLDVFNTISKHFTEIDKETYYSMIEVPIVDVNKE